MASVHWTGTRPPISLTYAKPEAPQLGNLSQTLAQLQQTLNDTKPQPMAAAPAVDIHGLTRQVCDQLERELRIERERRGL